MLGDFTRGPIVEVSVHVFVRATHIQIFFFFLIFFLCELRFLRSSYTAQKLFFERLRLVELFGDSNLVFVWVVDEWRFSRLTENQTGRVGLVLNSLLHIHY